MGFDTFQHAFQHGGSNGYASINTGYNIGFNTVQLPPPDREDAVAIVLLAPGAESPSLLHFSASCEHCLRGTLGGLGGFSDRNRLRLS
jgi:hypothetical protein